MFGICRSQQLRRVLIITLPFGKRVRTRTVRHSAWCRCHRRSWSRMMTSSRSRTTTCADTGMAVASVAAAAAHSTTIFISASSVSPGARGDAGVAKMFPEANPRRRVPCPRPPGARGARGLFIYCRNASRNRSFGKGGATSAPCPKSQPITISACRSAIVSMPPATALLSNRCARSMAV